MTQTTHCPWCRKALMDLSESTKGCFPCAVNFVYGDGAARIRCDRHHHKGEQ